MDYQRYLTGQIRRGTKVLARSREIWAIAYHSEHFNGTAWSVKSQVRGFDHYIGSKRTAHFHSVNNFPFWGLFLAALFIVYLLFLGTLFQGCTSASIDESNLNKVLAGFTNTVLYFIVELGLSSACWREPRTKMLIHLMHQAVGL
jgi:hypothetical protein